MNALKKIYVARDHGDAHVLRSLLQAAGIEVVIRGDDVFPLQGGSLLHMETRPSVWVLDDGRYGEALAIVAEYEDHDSAPPADATWRCERCGEISEGQFDVCWSCGRNR